MHFSNLITFLALAASTVAAPQATTTTPETTPSPSLIPTGPLYRLRTCVKDAAKQQFNNLYLWAYHTGAGLNDAVFTNNASATYIAKGFMNDTHQEFNLGNPFPYGLELAEVSFYAGWQPVRINAGWGDGGFKLNGSGLVTDENYIDPATNYTGVAASWGGWLVCDWWHDEPQLFWRNKFYTVEEYPAPSSCADVDLVPEYLRAA
ncbi:hypothetical protein LTS18_001391 [Coniosporium uncinatum]|uniref:Uncharacterized protein n=1 Tax=Coniosporium uncinatum TaxID=93489 RepID=A0ACC3D8C1_9PEZI|nr:hypothetical protein LTS18_001391 [Coniosporium uncinatum]